MNKIVIRNDPDNTEKAFFYLTTSTYTLSVCPKIMYGSDKVAEYGSHGGCDIVQFGKQKLVSTFKLEIRLFRPEE